jgi:hypothetical protein
MATDTEIKQTGSGEADQQCATADEKGRPWFLETYSWSAALAALAVVGLAFFAWRRFSS